MTALQRRQFKWVMGLSAAGVLAVLAPLLLRARG